MRNGEPIHFCSGGWKHRDDDCHCPCSFCHIYSEVSPRQSVEAELIDGSRPENGVTSVQNEGTP